MMGTVTTIHDMYAPGTHERKRADAAIESLRGVVVHDERNSVRGVAAHSLLRMADDVTIETLENGVDDGSLSALEALGYFGSLPRSIRGEYLKKFLQSDSTDVKIAVVSQLASDPAHQEFVRESILENPDVDVGVRIKTVDALNRYDKTFPMYALEIVSRRSPSDPISGKLANVWAERARKVRDQKPSIWVKWQKQLDEALVLQPTQPSLNMIKASLAEEGV